MSSQARAGHPTARGRDSSRRKPIYGTSGVVIYRVIYRIVYRFRPYGNDPNKSIMECLYLEPYRGKRPSAAKVTWLDEDQDWTQAPELGFLARVFNQDTFNLPKVQRGLRAAVAAGGGTAPLATYEEAKIRHFHYLLEKYINA